MNLYTVAPFKDGYRIYLSHIPGKRAMWSRQHFYTVPTAKKYLIDKLDVNPVRSYGVREALFDKANPRHAALARVEYRHNPHGEVVSVAPSYYTVRRTRYGIEEAIQYRVDPLVNVVSARKDSESISK